MQESVKVLFFIFVLGLISKNHLITASAALLISLIVTNIVTIDLTHQNFFMDIGLIFLIIGILLPFGTGNISLEVIYKGVLTKDGLIAALVGIACAVLAKKGVTMLEIKPEVMVGLVFGSIVGTAFFKGIPTGPLVAAGIAAFFIRLSRLFF